MSLLKANFKRMLAGLLKYSLDDECDVEGWAAIGSGAGRQEGPGLGGMRARGWVA